MGGRRASTLREKTECGLDEVCEEGLSDKAEANAGHGDAELSSGEEVAEVVEGAADDSRHGVALGSKVVDPCAASRDDCEFGRDKETVGRN